MSSDVAGVSVCPSAALDLGVELLCGMFELWGQLGAGILALTQWLLGEEEDGNTEEEADETSCLVSLLFDGHLEKFIFNGYLTLVTQVFSNNSPFYQILCFLDVINLMVSNL